MSLRISTPASSVNSPVGCRGKLRQSGLLTMFSFMDDDDDYLPTRASSAAAAGAGGRQEKKKKKVPAAGKSAAARTKKMKKKLPAGKSAAAKAKKMEKKLPAGRSAAAKSAAAEKRPCKKRGRPASSPVQAAKSPVQAAKRPGKAAHRGGSAHAVSYGSDCSGMGTDSVAMHRIFGKGSARHVFASDVDSSARYVIRRNYPPERMYKNMRGRMELRRGAVDVYTAGLLCSLTCQTWACISHCQDPPASHTRLRAWAWATPTAGAA